MYLEKYNLEGKIVVINGGARNIGFACAEAFSECGATVALTDINPIVKDSAKSLKKFGKNCSGHIVDLTDSKHVDETAKEILNIYKSIDIVVNNAGIARNTPAEEISDSEWLTGLLIQFPRPRRQTEAWFAFMHYNNHEPKDYWTLELGEDLCEEEGVLCAWNDEKQHRNYGLFIRPDPFVFLAAIRNKLDQSESDHEMLLSLHDYVEA